VSDRDTKVSVVLGAWLMHTEECASENNAKGVGAFPCNCGLDAALRSLQPASGEKAVCGRCKGKKRVPYNGAAAVVFPDGVDCPDCTPPTEQPKCEKCAEGSECVYCGGQPGDGTCGTCLGTGYERLPGQPCKEHRTPATDKAAGEDEFTLSEMLEWIANTHASVSGFYFSNMRNGKGIKDQIARHLRARHSPPTAPAARMTEADASTIERGALACDAVSKTYSEPWRAQIWRTHAAELRSLAARLGGQ
jgi:hypothetical protein